MNLSAYVRGNPVTFNDPSGLWTFSSGGEVSGALFGIGGIAGLYGNIAHDVNQPWNSGWSTSATFTAGGGVAAGMGVSGGMNFNASNANDVHDLGGVFYLAGRAGIDVYSVGAYLSPDQQIKGVSLTIGPSLGYIGAIAGGTNTWTIFAYSQNSQGTSAPCGK